MPDAIALTKCRRENGFIVIGFGGSGREDPASVHWARGVVQSGVAVPLGAG
jgi:hypothetical protein